MFSPHVPGPACHVRDLSKFEQGSAIRVCCDEHNKCRLIPNTWSFARGPGGHLSKISCRRLKSGHWQGWLLLESPGRERFACPCPCHVSSRLLLHGFLLFSGPHSNLCFASHTCSSLWSHHPLIRTPVLTSGAHPDKPGDCLIPRPQRNHTCHVPLPLPLPLPLPCEVIFTGAED